MLSSVDAKHQITLPYRRHVTHLIIQEYHQEAYHLGQEYVLSSLRQLHWVIKGQSAVHFFANIVCIESKVKPVENN